MTREQIITKKVEELQKYVGSTIEVEVTTIIEGSVVRPFRVVGYNPCAKMLIVDGGADGWTRLGRRVDKVRQAGRSNHLVRYVLVYEYKQNN